MMTIFKHNRGHFERSKINKRSKRVLYGLLFVLLPFVFFLTLVYPVQVHASFANYVIADGAVSHWNFEESADLLLDRIGDNRGIISGSPTRQYVSKVGNGYVFHPSTKDRVFLPSDAFDTHTQGAIEVIVKMNNIAGTHTILSAGSTSSNALIAFYIEDGVVRMANAFAEGGLYKISGNTVLTPSTFYHIVWQMDALHGVSIYINGIPETLTYEVGSPSNRQWWNDRAKDTSIYTVGALLLHNNYTGFLNGIIDELSVYRMPSSQKIWRNHTNIALGDTLTITSPKAYQVFQRTNDNRSDIAITGTYTGSPATIEASWNGNAYAPIVRRPQIGTYSGILRNQITGQGTLTVRFANNTAASTSVHYVSVGDVFWVAGQSNAEGRANRAEFYNHPTLKASMFREDLMWDELIEPTDSDSSGGFYSVWPLVATSLMADQNIPIAFITTADAGTGLAPPQEDWGKGGKSYVNALATIRASGVNGIKAILWHQGESDVANGVNQATYQTALSQMLDDMQDETGFIGMKLVAASLGPDTSEKITRENMDAIRSAIANRWENDSDILFGPVTYDVDLITHNGTNDGTHFKTAADVRTLSDRWWAALQYHFYGGVDGRGPRIRTAEYNDTKTEITLTFFDETLPLFPENEWGGFRVEDNGVPVGIRTIQKVADNKLTIFLESAASSFLTVSLGSFNDGAGAFVPRDSSMYTLPAETFTDYPVVLHNSEPSEKSSAGQKASVHNDAKIKIVVTRKEPLQKTTIVPDLKAHEATTSKNNQKTTPLFFPTYEVALLLLGIIVVVILFIKPG